MEKSHWGEEAGEKCEKVITQDSIEWSFYLWRKLHYENRVDLEFGEKNLINETLLLA
jgi:hypothetical protein